MADTLASIITLVILIYPLYLIIRLIRAIIDWLDRH